MNRMKLYYKDKNRICQQSLNLSFTTGVISMTMNRMKLYYKDKNRICQQSLNLSFTTGVISLKLEGIISKDDYYSVMYAKYILRGRFGLGEMVISKSGYFSCDYAIEVIGGRFRLGEESIMKNTWPFSYSFDYLVKVLGYGHD